MRDIPTFFLDALKLLPRARLLWIFAIFSLVATFLRDIKAGNTFFPGCILLLLTLALTYVGLVGQVDGAYQAVIKGGGDFWETLDLAREVFWRMLLFFLIFGAALLPFMCLIISLVGRPGANLNAVMNFAGAAGFLFSLFQPVYTFSLFNIIIKQWRTRQSIEVGLYAFVRHFLSLAIMGLVLAVLTLGLQWILMTGVMLITGAASTGLPGFADLASPAVTLKSGFLAGIIQAIVSLAFGPLSFLAFMQAYKKYVGFTEEAPVNPIPASQGTSGQL